MRSRDRALLVTATSSHSFAEISCDVIFLNASVLKTDPWMVTSLLNNALIRLIIRERIVLLLFFVVIDGPRI